MPILAELPQDWGFWRADQYWKEIPDQKRIEILVETGLPKAQAVSAARLPFYSIAESLTIQQIERAIKDIGIALTNKDIGLALVN